MHRWEEQEKLLAEMEANFSKHGIDYQDFSFQRKEFDSVPPVVPRFLLYLQVCLKPVCKQLREESKR